MADRLFAYKLDKPFGNVQRAALTELKANGPGGLFDSKVMSQLMGMGLIEIRNRDRVLVMTDRGKQILDGHDGEAH